MTKFQALQLGCQVASGILSNPVAAARIFNGMFDVQVCVRDCTQMVVAMSNEMGIPITEDAPQNTKEDSALRITGQS